MKQIMVDSYPNKWYFYRSQFAGNPCAKCLTCGHTYVYWETDDLEAHTEQHEMETTK